MLLKPLYELRVLIADDPKGPQSVFLDVLGLGDEFLDEPRSDRDGHIDPLRPILLLIRIDAQADRDGEVLGYLAGCVDSTRAPSPKAALTRVAVRYALLLRPGTAGFFWRGIRESLGRETPSGELRDPRWPAHLHIDLLPQGRGQGVGTALVNAWFARLRALGVPGCHLSTFAENTAAIRFFERVGFRRHGDRIRTPGMRSPSGEQHHLQYLVRDL